MEEEVQELTAFNDVNKIEYVLLWLTNNVQLRIGVNTYTITKKFGRTSYYKEIQYFNNQYQRDVVNVQMNPETYLSINQLTDKNGYKADIKMNFQMAMTLRTSLETLYNVLNERYNEFYAKVDDDKYIVTKRINPLEINTMFGQKILLYPDIVEFSNGEFTGGVRIVLGDPNNSIVVPLSTIQTMYECIASLDFFSYGLHLLQLACQPQFGSNRIIVGEKKQSAGGRYFHK